MKKLPCISIRQPWASAIMIGAKPEEYRTWSVKLRGLLGIHASKTLADAESFDLYPNFSRERVPRGVLLGVVKLLDCEDRRDDYAGAPYFAWKLAGPIWLPKPVEVKGQASLFWLELADEQLPPELREKG